MDLPAWGQGKSKRKRSLETDEASAASDASIPTLDAVDRGVAKVGRPMVNHVYLIVGGLIAVAAIVAGVQYMRGEGESSNAASTRALAKGLAPLARGQVVPEGEDMPKVANDPLARSQDELLDQADSALRAAAANEDPAGLAAKLAQASLAMRKGDAVAAISQYSAYLAAAKPDHPMRPVALEGYALALEQKGDLKGALEQLDKITKVSDHAKARKGWHRGRILVALGRPDEAKDALKLASEQPAGGIESRLAKSLLATLGKAPGATP